MLSEVMHLHFQIIFLRYYTVDGNLVSLRTSANAKNFFVANKVAF